MASVRKEVVPEQPATGSKPQQLYDFG